MAQSAESDLPDASGAIFPTRSLADVAFLVAFAGYEREADACVPLCRATAKDFLLMENVVNLLHGRHRRTRLMYAAGHGKVDRLHWLLQCNARTGLVDHYGRTALAWTYRRYQEVTGRVLCTRADFDVVSGLKYLAWLGLTDLITAGLAAGGAMSVVEEELRAAAVLGDRDAVARLLAVPGMSANALNRYCWTPLMLASANGRAAVVRELLSAPGVAVNAATPNGTTALMFATKDGHTEVVRQLLAAPGVDLNATDHEGQTALMSAAQDGQLAAVRELLAAPGIAVNAADRLGRTALTLAAEGGHVAIVRDLLAAPGVNVNMAIIFESTALMLAAQCGHTAVVHELLAAPGVDVNLADAGGLTALILAARNDCLAAVRELLNFPGVVLDAVDKRGWTALMWAQHEGHEAVAKLLLAAAQQLPDVGTTGTGQRAPAEVGHMQQSAKHARPCIQHQLM